MKILSDYLDQKDARLLQILGLLILIIAVGYVLFSKGDELVIAKSLGVGSLGLATMSIGLAIDSGNRMKVIANSTFVGVAGIFENERYRIRNTHPVSEAIWKSFTYAREAMILKDYVDEEYQEMLIARFKEFLDELYQIKQRMNVRDRNLIFDDERNGQLENTYDTISELDVFEEHVQYIIQQLIYLDIEV